MASFRFDEAKHLGYLNELLIPSVTQVIEGNGIFDASRYPEDAKVRGQRIHLLCEYLDEGDYDPAEAKRFGLEGYVESWRKLREREQFEIIQIEKRMVDPLRRFHGQPDRLVRWRKRLSILDLKSGASEKWHPLQTGGYDVLYRANGITEPLFRYGIHLDENGGLPSLKPHENDDDPEAFLIFLNATHRRKTYGHAGFAVSAR